jgi:transposase
LLVVIQVSSGGGGLNGETGLLVEQCAVAADRAVAATIPPNPTRKYPHRYDKRAYKGRNVIERMFCRLKDFRRIATRYDKRADTFLSAVLLAAAMTWWT